VHVELKTEQTNKLTWHAGGLLARPDHPQIGWNGGAEESETMF